MQINKSYHDKIQQSYSLVNHQTGYLSNTDFLLFTFHFQQYFSYILWQSVLIVEETAVHFLAISWQEQATFR